MREYLFTEFRLVNTVVDGRLMASVTTSATWTNMLKEPARQILQSRSLMAQL